MDEKISLQDLAAMLARRYGMSQEEASGFIKDFFVLIEKALVTDSYVNVKGLGTFRMVDVESRGAEDGVTGQPVPNASRRKVSFSPDPELKELVNKPFSHFEAVPLNGNVTFADIPSSVVPAPDPSGTEEKEIPDIQSTAPEHPENGTLSPDESHSAEPSPAPAPVPQPSSARTSVFSRVFAVVVALVVVVCLSLIASLYWSDGIHTTFGEKKADSQSYDGQSLSVLSSDDGQLSDASAVQSADTVALADTSRVSATPASPTVQDADRPAAEQKSSVEAVRKKPVADKSEPRVVPVSTGYRMEGVKATHVLAKGETLTQVSLRYYGTKALWPYIVKANRSVITDPNNVPRGTKLKIPKLVKISVE